MKGTSMGTYKLDVEKIRELSFNLGLSLAGLCKEAGIDRSRATAWKTKGVYPSTAYKIAQILDTDPMDLIVKEDI